MPRSIDECNMEELVSKIIKETVVAPTKPQIQPAPVKPAPSKPMQPNPSRPFDPQPGKREKTKPKAGVAKKILALLSNFYK